MGSKKRERPPEPADEDDVPFPRGGASVLTPLEERKLKMKAKADFEKESTLTKRPKGKKARSAGADEEVLLRTACACIRNVPWSRRNHTVPSDTGRVVPNQGSVRGPAQVCGAPEIHSALLLAVLLCAAPQPEKACRRSV
jgi:hypothetical protein